MVSLTLIKISDIIIGNRFRKDFGDIDSLAKSIEKHGLLHPPVLRKVSNGNYVVICGVRRIAAYLKLGRKEIEATIISLSDFSYHDAEVDENNIRKDFTISEIAEIDEELRKGEEEAARQRQKEGLPSLNFNKGRSSANIAQRLGKSYVTLEKIRFLKDVATKNPTLYKSYWDRANRTDKIDKPYRKVKQIERREEAKRAALGRILPANKTRRYELILGDFREKGKEIPDNSFDAVFCDPPYAEEFLYLAEPLGLLSWKVLIPGSSLFVIFPSPGKSYLHYLDAIRKCGFQFVQEIPIIHSGGIDRLHEYRILAYKKPLMWFYKPDSNGKMTIYKDMKNVIYSEAPNKDEKKDFEWLQSPIEVKHALDAVTVPKMKVLDPMAGEGTTGIGALELCLYFTGIEINKETYDKAVFRLSRF
jgi:ParB-like chromosome segregation protein Spo0J